MNNSRIALETPVDNSKELTVEREAKLVRTIEALQDIRGSESWSTLKKEVFDSVFQTLKRELEEEARKENPNTNKLNRITGEIKWAERFADLEKFEHVLRVELQGVRTRIHGTNE